jgi:hypothetical protein
MTSETYKDWLIVSVSSLDTRTRYWRVTVHISRRIASRQRAETLNVPPVPFKTKDEAEAFGIKWERRGSIGSVRTEAEYEKAALLAGWKVLPQKAIY